VLRYGYEIEPRDDSLNANDTKRLRRELTEVLNRERTLLARIFHR
jgi:hypothetical protein